MFLLRNMLHTPEAFILGSLTHIVIQEKRNTNRATLIKSWNKWVCICINASQWFWPFKKIYYHLFLAGTCDPTKSKNRNWNDVI